MISEVGVWCSPITTNAGKRVVSITAKAEICIPQKYGLPATVVTGKDIASQIYFPNPDDINDTNAIVGPGTLFGNATTSTTEGSYTFVTYSRQVNNIPVPATFARRPTLAYARLVLNVGADGTGNGQLATPFWDLAPVAHFPAATNLFPLAASTGISLPVDAEGVAVASIQSAQVSDPRINKYQTNWEAGANTFGLKNVNWQRVVSASPPQDTDGGAISDASMEMPLPASKVSSVAELGRIPTGTALNVPWRTIRFQPTPSSTNLPDWVLCDLFMAPYFPTNNSALYTPRPNAVAGRVNLNTRLQPFDTEGRVLPISALFKDATNAPTFTPALIAQAVTNIAQRTYATGGKNLGGTNGFLSVGELAEIAGVADSGESSERRLLGVFDLATVQGNVFRVYSLGQALQQTKAGKLVPQAEKLVVAIIERLDDGTLRTLYWRVVPM
jgi:hypothetical protein